MYHKSCIITLTLNLNPKSMEPCWAPIPSICKHGQKCMHVFWKLETLAAWGGAAACRGAGWEGSGIVREIRREREVQCIHSASKAHEDLS